MEPWFVEILKQFPALVIAGFGIWQVMKFFAKRFDQERLTLEKLYEERHRDSADAANRHLEDVKRGLQEALSGKDALVDKLTEEIKQLRKELTLLIKKIPPRNDER